jgi:hypothetical protein
VNFFPEGFWLNDGCGVKGFCDKGFDVKFGLKVDDCVVGVKDGRNGVKEGGLKPSIIIRSV